MSGEPLAEMSLVKYLLISIFLTLLPTSEAGSSENEDALRILFVGNSLTYYNDLPELTRQLYESVYGQGSMHVEMLAAGGKSIHSHMEDGHLHRILENGSFDIVVLQDIGGWPICDPSFPGCKDAVPSMKRAVLLVKDNNAAPIWYSTFQSIHQVQEALSKKVQTLSEDWAVSVADVGAALGFYRDQLKQRDGFLEDGHPDLVGSLIGAATIATAISGTALDPGLDNSRFCFRRWQGSGLLSTKLASDQEGPPRSCEEIPPVVIERVIDSANNGFSADAGKPDAG